MTCGGIQNESRPISTCHMMSHCTPHPASRLAPSLEILVQAAGALRVAEALVALDPRLAALLFGDGLPLAGAERFPLHQPDTVPALQDAREEERQEVVGISRRGGDQIEIRCDPFTQDGAVQRFLVAEVVVEHPLVHSRRAGDRVHARAGEALGDELTTGCAPDALAGADRIAA